MAGVDQGSTVILLVLLIPGSLLILFMLLCWFRLLNRQRIIQIIQQNRSPQTLTKDQIHIKSSGQYEHSRGYGRTGRHGGRVDLESGTTSPVSVGSGSTGVEIDDILAKESTITSTKSSWTTSSEKSLSAVNVFHGHSIDEENAKTSRKTRHKKAKDRRWRREPGVHKEIGAHYSKKSKKFRPKKDSNSNVDLGNHGNSRNFGISQEPPRISIGSLGSDRYGPWYVHDDRHTGMMNTGSGLATGTIRNNTDLHQTGGSLAPHDSVQMAQPSDEGIDLSIPREIPGTLGTLVIPLPNPPVARVRQSIVRDSGLSRDFTFPTSDSPLPDSPVERVRQSIARDSGLSRNFTFHTSDPPAVPTVTVATVPGAISTPPPEVQSHQDGFGGFGKAKDLKPLSKSKLRDSDESSVD